MLVHEFITDKTDDGKHRDNAVDMDSFLCRISAGEASSMESGMLLGPFFVPGNPLFSANTALYLGKVQRNTRSCHS